MSKAKNFFQKYSKLSKEVRAAFWYTICNVLIKAISLITVPIFTRILTESDYGIVSVYNGWYEIFVIIATLNLFYSAYNTANIKYQDSLDSFTSSMIGLIDTIIFVLVSIYLCGRPFFDKLFELPSGVMIIILCQLLTYPAYNFWMARERFRYNYRIVVLTTIIVSISAPLISILLVFLVDTDKALFKILGTALPTIIAGFILTLNIFRRGQTYFNREYWAYGLKFNIPLIPHYLSGTVLTQSDRIMISKMISLDKAGIYSVAYSASFTIGIVTNAINQSLTPWMYNNMKQGEYEPIGKRTNQILGVFAIVLLLFILVIPEVIIILAPASYSEAVDVLPVLVVSVYFQFLYGFFGSIDFYFEQSIFPMIASVIAAITNMCLNYIFIPKYGYFAAGYTTLVSFIVMAITHYIFMKIVLKKNKVFFEIFNIKTITLISLAVIFIGFCELLLYKYVVIRYTIAFLVFLGLILNRNKVIKIVKMGK